MFRRIGSASEERRSSKEFDNIAVELSEEDFYSLEHLFDEELEAIEEAKNNPKVFRLESSRENSQSIVEGRDGLVKNGFIRV